MKTHISTIITSNVYTELKIRITRPDEISFSPSFPVTTLFRQVTCWKVRTEVQLPWLTPLIRNLNSSFTRTFGLCRYEKPNLSSRYLAQGRGGRSDGTTRRWRSYLCRNTDPRTRKNPRNHPDQRFSTTLDITRRLSFTGVSLHRVLCQDTESLLEDCQVFSMTWKSPRDNVRPERPFILRLHLKSHALQIIPLGHPRYWLLPFSSFVLTRLPLQLDTTSEIPSESGEIFLQLSNLLGTSTGFYLILPARN